MTQKPCLGAQCELWDDERDLCALRPENLYFKIREAVTDAAVDLEKAAIELHAITGGDSDD